MRGLAFICSKPQPDAEANLAKRAETIARAKSDGVAALFDGMAQSFLAKPRAATAPRFWPRCARA